MRRPLLLLYITLLISVVRINLGDAAGRAAELHRDRYSCAAWDVAVKRAQVSVGGDTEVEALVAHREVDYVIGADCRRRHAGVLRLGGIVRSYRRCRPWWR